MKRVHLQTLLFGISLATSSIYSLTACRVVEGPLSIAPNEEQAALKKDIRNNIQPAIKSFSNTVDTIGKVYHASMTLSGSTGNQKAEGSIFDGASLFIPSAEDELVITPKTDTSKNFHSAMSKSSLISNHNSNKVLSARSNLNGTTRETYDFTYSLVKAQSIDLPDPSFKLTVEAKGSVDVIEGKAYFNDVIISATVRSVSSDIVAGPFVIAHMTASADHSHSFKISFSDYIKLVKSINSNASFDDEARGTIELVITKVDATLAVKGLHLNSASKLNIEALSGHWDFSSRSFTGEAKVTLATKVDEFLGVDVTIHDDAKITTKVFKRETLPTQ